MKIRSSDLCSALFLLKSMPKVTCLHGEVISSAEKNHELTSMASNLSEKSGRVFPFGQLSVGTSCWCWCFQNPGNQLTTYRGLKKPRLVKRKPRFWQILQVSCRNIPARDFVPMSWFFWVAAGGRNKTNNVPNLWATTMSLPDLDDPFTELSTIHPWRLTWNINMEVWKMKWVICGFHVNLPGCIMVWKVLRVPPNSTYQQLWIPQTMPAGHVLVAAWPVRGVRLLSI